MKKAKLGAVVLAVTLMLAFPLSCAVGQDVPRLDKDTLKGWLSDPQVIILDVRQPQDWQASAKKIQGAVRREPNEVKTWAAGLPKDQKIVLYCAWHSEGTSARVAQQLLDLGFKQVWALKGGWLEWDQAGYPTEPRK